MKKTTLFPITIFIFSQVFSQREIKITPEIKSASIYLSGAELIRSATVKIDKGETSIIFNDLSHKIIPKSIRITTQDDVDLLSMSHKINYLTDNKDAPKLKILKDSLKINSAKIQALNDEADAYNTEKKMLLTNLSIGGNNNGVSIVELKQASDFYRTRISEINTKISSINSKLSELSIKNSRLQSELSQLNIGSTYPRSEITVIVNSDIAKTTSIEIKYIVTDAGWSPSYDIKAADTDKPVDLIYRAKVFNNTGIDWKDLSFKLSTADPTLSAEKPVLKPWYLNFVTYSYKYKAKGERMGEGYQQNAIVLSESRAPESVQQYGNELNVGDNIIGGNTFEEMEIPQLSAEFNIKKRYSFPADDKPYIVEISTHELPATYKHFAVTKMDKDVFLTAQITGWEDLNLVAGPANVYYAGTYLGQSFIDTRNVKDTLDLSLGRDNKVMITRSKLTNFSSTQFIGTKKKETKTFELIAKNNRKTTVQIQLYDQLPISQTEEIEVKAIEISGAEYNITTGELKWDITLAPGESKKITLSYYIKYPKNKNLETIQNKSQQIRYKF